MKKGSFMLGVTFAWAGAASAFSVDDWTAQVQSVMSALKVTAKQEAVSSDKSDATAISAAQAQASVLVDISNRTQVMQAVDQFGEKSQLVDGCYQVAMADTTTGIAEKTAAKAQTVMAMQGRMSADGEVRSGGLSGMVGGTKKVAEYPFGADVNKRINRHLDRYCSVSEASAGYCTLNANGMQSGDSDFSVHLAPGKTFGWDQTEAASDFAKTIAPIEPVPKYGDCSSLECSMAVSERRKDDAMMSMARFSMVQFVESRSTQADGDAKKAGAN